MSIAVEPRPAALQVEVEPAQVGLDADRLARADRHLARYVDEGRIPNSLLIVSRGGKIAHIAAHGQRDPDTAEPADTATIWRIFSMTKPITSVAAMMLYEEGAFELIDPLERYLPAFANMRVYRRGAGPTIESVPATEPIRIWHLLTHTSGLTYSFFFTHPVDAAYRTAGLDAASQSPDSLATVCDKLATQPLLFEPGTEWNYSMATDVLGRLVEVVSGQSLDVFFAKRILGPLGMHETGFWAPTESQARLAALYTPDPSTGRLVRGPADAGHRSQPVFLSGGGGLVSTAADYHRFTRMLLNGGELDGVRLLSPRTITLMASNHLPGGADLQAFARPLGDLLRPGFGFGLGFWMVVDPVQAKSPASPGAFGWGGAAGTEFWVDPAEEMIVLFFTQIIPSLTPLRHQLRQMVYQAVVD